MSDLAAQPAHWVLAELGKRVLRPGGTELTLALVDALDVGPSDDVVEFAPGVGFTAERVLERRPASYTGIELDEEAAADLDRRLGGSTREFRVGNAANTALADGVADVVYGEAMLTMHPDDGKASIIEEAYRLCRSGGRYGIHELAVSPDDLDAATKSTIQSDLAAATQVNARPLTRPEWVTALEAAGFEVDWTATAPMQLLEPRRVLADEGLVGTLRFVFNLATQPDARRRVRQLRRTFTRHADHLTAISLVARKP
jgi:SAM-dependent methyltransferase